MHCSKQCWLHYLMMTTQIVLSHRIFFVAPIQVKYLLDNVCVNSAPPNHSRSFRGFGRRWWRRRSMSMSSESFKKAVRWVFLKAMTYLAFISPMDCEKRILRGLIDSQTWLFSIGSSDRSTSYENKKTQEAFILTSFLVSEYWKRIKTLLAWKGILQCW